MSRDIYKPIESKINTWIWYEENRPKSDYQTNRQEHDEFRKKFDLDCVLTNGSLKADTMFSLWLPLRFTLVQINGYSKPDKLGTVCKSATFLRKLLKYDVLRDCLPDDDKRVIALSELFDLGQTRANIMLLPERWMQARGNKPFYDYMPYFLYECFAGGHFSSAFHSDQALRKWISEQHLEGFFHNNHLCREKLRDLSGSGTIKNGVPKDILVLLNNYIDILKQRKIRLDDPPLG